MRLLLSLIYLQKNRHGFFNEIRHIHSYINAGYWMCIVTEATIRITWIYWVLHMWDTTLSGNQGVILALKEFFRGNRKHVTQYLSVFHMGHEKALHRREGNGKSGTQPSFEEERCSKKSPRWGWFQSCILQNGINLHVSILHQSINSGRADWDP